MFHKFNTPMKSAVILSLILVLALSAAWATINYYYKSKMMGMGAGFFANVVHQGKDRIKATVDSGALDNYLLEQGVDEVGLAILLAEELVEQPDGSSYYRLEFTFWPSGAYFETPLEIQLRGKYVSESTDVQMYDEYGEVLESTSNGNGSVVTYYVPHFSSYYYDSYDGY